MEILVDGEKPLTLHLGDSFGVEPTLKKMHHKGIMKTRVDDCQVTAATYYQLSHSDDKYISTQRFCMSLSMHCL